MTNIDARGLSCPIPVVMAMQAVEKAPAEKEFEVLVDNFAAKENVSRFAVSRGFTVEIAENGAEFTLRLSR